MVNQCQRQIGLLWPFNVNKNYLSICIYYYWVAKGRPSYITRKAIKDTEGHNCLMCATIIVIIWLFFTIIYVGNHEKISDIYKIISITDSADAIGERHVVTYLLPLFAKHLTLLLEHLVSACCAPNIYCWLTWLVHKWIYRPIMQWFIMKNNDQ